MIRALLRLVARVLSAPWRALCDTIAQAGEDYSTLIAVGSIQADLDRAAEEPDPRKRVERQEAALLRLARLDLAEALDLADALDDATQGAVRRALAREQVRRHALPAALDLIAPVRAERARESALTEIALAAARDGAPEIARACARYRVRR